MKMKILLRNFDVYISIIYDEMRTARDPTKPYSKRSSSFDDQVRVLAEKLPEVSVYDTVSQLLTK